MGTTENTAADTAVRNLQSASAAPGGRTPNAGIAGSVGIGKANAPEDVLKVSGALAANGLMDAPQAHADSMLLKGLIGAQERMDSALKRDGIVNPGGPTEQAFSRLAGQGFVKPALAPANAGARPATGDKVLNAKLRAESKHDAVAAAEARIKANLSDDTRSEYRKAQDRNRLIKAREDAESADARARHEQAERTRRLQERRAAAAQKAANEARDDALENRQRAERALNVLADKASDVLDSVLDGINRHSRESGKPVAASNELDKALQVTGPGAAAIARPTADPGSEDEKPVPDDPGQDDPEEPDAPDDTPDETPDELGQDDPEDPCAQYEQAVADAEDEVEALEIRADELEREIADLANQVMELEREKQQIIWELDGRFAIHHGVDALPVHVIVKIVDFLIGDDDAAYRAKQAKLKSDLEKLEAKASKTRERMHIAKEQLTEIISELAEVRRALAQAEANLRRCEQG